MNVLRWSTKALQRLSPAGLIVGGIAALSLLPAVRKGLRCAAVAAAKSIYSVIDEAKSIQSPPAVSEEVKG